VQASAGSMRPVCFSETRCARHVYGFKATRSGKRGKNGLNAAQKALFCRTQKHTQFAGVQFPTQFFFFLAVFFVSSFMTAVELQVFRDEKRRRGGEVSPFAQFAFPAQQSVSDARGNASERAPSFLARKYAFSGRVLGYGSFATVHEAVARANGHRVAVKEIADDNWKNGKSKRFSADQDDFEGSISLHDSEDDGEPFPPEDFVREAHALQKLFGTGGAVNVRESFVDTFHRRCWIVMDRMDNTLQDWLECTNAAQRRNVAWPVSKALAHALQQVHAVGLAHRDLKPCNVLINVATKTDEQKFPGGVHVKLGDFGLSREMPVGQRSPGTPRVVSLPFRAPELLVANLWCAQPPGEFPYDGPAVDVWSLGCVIFQIHASNDEPLFAWESEQKTLQDIVAFLGAPPALLEAARKTKDAPRLLRAGQPATACMCEVCKMHKKHSSLFCETLPATEEDFLARNRRLRRHCARAGPALAQCLAMTLPLDPAARASAKQVYEFCRVQRNEK